MEKCAFCKVKETALYESDVPVCPKCVGRLKRTTTADVYLILVRNLTEATLRAESANFEFDAVVRDVPSQIPQPDGTQRIRNASRTLKVARDEMMTAHNRLNDFLRTGIVP